jgi:hypothetical protein
MNFISVHGRGDPNEEDGDFKNATDLLYGMAFTIRMIKRSRYEIEGFYDSWSLRWKVSGHKGTGTRWTIRRRMPSSRLRLSVFRIS